MEPSARTLRSGACDAAFLHASPGARRYGSMATVPAGPRRGSVEQRSRETLGARRLNGCGGWGGANPSVDMGWELDDKLMIKGKKEAVRNWLPLVFVSFTWHMGCGRVAKFSQAGLLGLLQKGYPTPDYQVLLLKTNLFTSFRTLLHK